MNSPLDIGIQLYSVRDSMGEDFEGTLKKIHEQGYTSVEFAGFYGHSAEEVKEMLLKYDLRVSGTHSPIDDLLNNYEETIKFHKTIGNTNYIFPYIELTNQEKLDDFIKKANIVNEKLENDGITFSFHNHHQEFLVNEDGSVPYEQLLYRTNIKFEVDTYWAFVGMGHPTVLLDRIHDRVRFIHLKDGLKNGQGKPLGMGEAPLKDVIASAKQYNIPMVVESETCSPSGLEESQICIDYLKNL